MARYYLTVYYQGSTNDAWGYPENATYETDSGIAYVTIPSHVPARTGHTFDHWNDSQDATGNRYYPGESYSLGVNPALVNTSWYLYAQWSPNKYSVSYDSNGGSGTLETQYKTYNEPLTLTSTIPTRTNYTFKGWGLSRNATTVAYSAGGTYTDNADITLYAIWELNYSNPTISDFKTYRSDASGNPSDSATYFKVSLDWTANVSASSILVEWVPSGGTTWSNGIISISGTSGSSSGVFGSGNISVDRNYNIRVTVIDSKGSTTVTGRVGGQSYTVDFMPGGSGVAFGKYAEQEDLFEVDWNAQFNGTVNIPGEAHIATYDNLIATLRNEITGVLQKAYPVNSIYLSYSHTSPATLFGFGTWERIAPHYLYAAGDEAVIGDRIAWEQIPFNGADGANYGGTGVTTIKISAWRRTA